MPTQEEVFNTSILLPMLAQRCVTLGLIENYKYIVKISKDEFYMSYQPHSIKYTNDLDQIQQISIPQETIGETMDNSINYSGIFGNYSDLLYTYSYRICCNELP